MIVSGQTILVVLVIAAVLSLIQGRWKIRYLQCAGRLLSGAFLIQFTRHFSSVRLYLFAGLGICWFVFGLLDLHRQLISPRVEVSD